MPIIARNDSNEPELLRTNDTGIVYAIITDGISDIHVCPDCHGLVVSPADHYRIAQSNMWVMSHIKRGLAAAGSFFIHLKVGAAKNAHVSILISVEAEASWWLHENPTLTDDGTGLSEVCVNRETPAVATMTTFRDPAITLTGIELETGKIGAGSRIRAAGALVEATGWWFLKKGESYLIRVDNDDANVQDISITVKWHEE